MRVRCRSACPNRLGSTSWLHFVESSGRLSPQQAMNITLARSCIVQVPTAMVCLCNTAYIPEQVVSLWTSNTQLMHGEKAVPGLSSASKSSDVTAPVEGIWGMQHSTRSWKLSNVACVRPCRWWSFLREVGLSDDHKPRILRFDQAGSRQQSGHMFTIRVKMGHDNNHAFENLLPCSGRFDYRA